MLFTERLDVAFCPHQRKAKTKLMMDSTVSPPYTQPRLAAIQAAMGVPANSARPNGTMRGVQQGLVTQATPNMRPPRIFFHLDIRFFLALNCDPPVIGVSGDEITHTLVITIFIGGQGRPIAPQAGECMAQSQQIGDAAVNVGQTLVERIHDPPTGQ